MGSAHLEDGTEPSFAGGVAITISGTSTTDAGTAFMITVEGYTALPPGT